MWIDGLRTYHAVRRFKYEMMKDPRNLFRTHHTCDIPQPRHITSTIDVDAYIAACTERLSTLKESLALHHEKVSETTQSILCCDVICRQWKNHPMDCKTSIRRYHHYTQDPYRKWRENICHQGQGMFGRASSGQTTGSIQSYEDIPHQV